MTPLPEETSRACKPRFSNLSIFLTIREEIVGNDEGTVVGESATSKASLALSYVFEGRPCLRTEELIPATLPSELLDQSALLFFPDFVGLADLRRFVFEGAAERPF